MGPGAHLLDDQERRQAVEVGLAAPRRPRRPHRAVDVEPRPENRRVADPPRYLPRESARRGHAADAAAGIDAVAVDGAVQLVLGEDPLGDQVEAGAGVPRARVRRAPAVGIEIVPRVGAALPLEPQAARTVRVQVVLDGEAELPGEPLSARADEQVVVGEVGDQPGHARRRAHPFEGGDASRPPLRAVHAAGVELHHPVGVGAPAVADAGVFGVELDDVDPGDQGVEHIVARRHPPEGGLDAGLRPAVPVAVAVGGGDDHRGHGPRGLDGRRPAEGGPGNGEPRRGRGHELATIQLGRHGVHGISPRKCRPRTPAFARTSIRGGRRP